MRTGLSMCYYQKDEFAADRWPPASIEVLPIDDIYLVRQIAVAERLGEARPLVERQTPTSIDHQVEIGVEPGATRGARAEYPCFDRLRQMRAKDCEHGLFVVRGQIDR